MKKWTLNSWRNYPVKHIPKYEDEKELTMVLKKISSFPPLVFGSYFCCINCMLGSSIIHSPYLFSYHLVHNILCTGQVNH